ncbi:MAG: hypothetical protein WA126_09065 [Thermodesulfovibrionales bacterium]
MFFASYSGKRRYGGYGIKDGVIEISKVRWQPEINVEFNYKYGKKQQRGGTLRLGGDIAQCLATAILLIRNGFVDDDKYVSIEVHEDKVAKVQTTEKRKSEDEPE